MCIRNSAENKQVGYHRNDAIQRPQNTFRTQFDAQTWTFGTQAQGNNVVVDKLLDLEQLNVENQLRVGRNAREALLAICEAGRDGDTALATDRHARDTDIPALDNFTLPELEVERLALFVG